MLTNDPKRLRLFRIDLHSRTRRRAAVVLTYLAYFAATTALGVFFADRQTPWSEYLTMAAWTAVFMRSGVFREKGPVKRTDERPNLYRDMVLLRGLDDWARYLYGGSYESLSPEQQHQVLRKYKIGGYLLPAKNKHAGFDPEIPDERELAERNRASTCALQLMTVSLFSLAGYMIVRAVAHLSPGDMPSLFLALGLAAFTLPKSVILWNEADPRELLQVEETIESEPADSR